MQPDREPTRSTRDIGSRDRPADPVAGSLAIVSGGSSGIGLACAAQLAGMGHRVALLARDEARLARAVEAIQGDHPAAQVSGHALDVRDAAACAAAVEALVGRYGPPAWLVNSAGIAEPGLFLEQPLAAHEAQLATNYLGSLYLSHAAAPHMAAAGGGRLVFISSGAGLFGIYGYSAYAPSKFAVRGLAEVLRVELAPHGIGVTIAYPPDTRTPQLEAEQRTKPEATRRITAGGGEWEAVAVAQKVLAGALAGRFAVSPGLPTAFATLFHSLISPLLRARQRRLVAAVASQRAKD
ncbi:SDR family oxidoreductase [Ancylobacter oerskovii]|uniref:3-dehydrosphinganine reductase n=1 Tax=Ancylobacter oerskovii TaxID=459519 RepID=A0ABW4YW30_9HYPH|nr:SDR family oxidoreductase [Ancylobacter oerskovii]MBS7544285.1 SDR family oxidoreductase [Ancylobacter oerskovii]